MHAVVTRAHSSMILEASPQYSGHSVLTLVLILILIAIVTLLYCAWRILDLGS